MNKKILLAIILISCFSWSQVSSKSAFDLCIENRMNSINNDLKVYTDSGINIYYITSRIRILSSSIYTATFLDLAITQANTPPSLIYWRYTCEEDQFFDTGYSSLRKVISSIQKSNIPVQEFLQAKACGSIIDYNLGTVLEEIPILGTEFSINYNSFYNPNLLNNSRVQISYQILQEKGYDHRVKLMNKDGTVLDTAYYSSLFDFVNYDKIANFPEAVSFDSEFFKISEFKIGLDRSLVIQTPRPDDPNHIDQNWVPSEYGNSKTIYQYKPRAWGLSGWSISNHHFFDKTSKTLFTGYGDILSYDNYKTVEVSPYGQVNVVIEKSSGSEIYIFDPQGRHLETRDTTWNKPTTRFIYSGNKIAKIINRYNLETVFNYNSDSQLVSITSPYGLVTSFTINNENIEKVVNPLNQEYVMIYGTQKELLSFKDPSGLITSFEYSPEGKLLKETKNNGLSQSFSEVFLGSTKVLQHKLNSFFKNFMKTELPLQYTSENDGIGSQMSIHDSENKLIYKDSLYPGQPIKKTQSVDEDIVTNYNFGTTWGKDLISGTNTFRKIASIGSDFNEITNNSVQTVVSSADNISTVTKTVKFSQANKNSTVVYDNSNKLFSYSDSDGMQSTVKINELGLPIEIKDKDKPTKTLTYDSQYRLSKIQQGSLYWTYSYDQYGNTSEVISSTGEKTSYQRNILGQVLKTTLPNGDSVSYEYTDGGSIKKIILPNGQTHYFTYSLGEYIASQLSPGSKNTFYDYDNDKRLTKLTKPSGKIIEYVYKQDSANLLNIKTPTGIIKVDTVDSRGRVTDITSTDSIRVETSWIADQIKEQKWYDDDGSIIAVLTAGFRKDKLAANSFSLNGNEFVNYGLSDVNSPSGINNKFFCYVNQLQKGVACNSGTMTYNVFSSASGDDSDTLLNSKLVRKVSNTDTNYVSYTHEVVKSFNLFGGVKTVSEKNYGIVSYDLNNQEPFNKTTQLDAAYDGNVRLTGVVSNMSILYGGKEISKLNESRSYSYPLGSNNNIKEYTSDSKRSVASHNNEDQLIKLTGSVNKDYQYTDDGDLKSITSCKGTTNFEYDVLGNLKKVTLSDGKVIEYKVDGMNRRVKKIVNGQIKEYYLWYDQLHLAAVLDENKQAKVKYIYTIDSPSASLIEKNGVLYKIVHDPGLGSVRYIVNIDTKDIVQEIEYDEMGNMIYNSNKDFQVLGYAGGLFDSDTGLTRFGARDYDPTIGRWTSKDPIGFAGGDTNLYAYVSGNPLSYIDPSGLKVGDWWDLPANFNRAQEIAAEELKRRPNAHNDYEDALRHYEWSRRTTEETNSFTAFVSGWGHEVQYFFQRGRMPALQYLSESLMDIQNNASGRVSGKKHEAICPNPNRLSTSPGTIGGGEY